MTCTILSTGEELQFPCKNEQEPPYPAMKYRLYELIAGLFDEECDRFFVNCEYGVPLWAAEYVCALKEHHAVELHIVVPFEEQTTDWQEEFRDRYYKVHELADTVIFADTQRQPDSYHKAARMMVDESDVLVICGREGSCEVLAEYARRSGVKLGYYDVMH